MRSFFAASPPRTAIILAIFGFLLNLYPLPLFANVQLILGNAAYVIAAVILGPRYAVAVALVCAAGLFLTWDTKHVFVLFPLEALVLALARRRGIYSLYAGVGFWLLIGTPLFYLYGLTLTSLPVSHLPFIAFKQAINGLFYIGLGAVLLLMMPKLAQINPGYRNAPERFSDKLTYSFTLFISLALLIAALLFNQFFIDRQQLLIKKNLQDNAVHLSQLTFDYLREHQRAIIQGAEWLSMMGDDFERQDWLTQFNHGYPAFLTMLIANDRGNIVAASPAARMMDDAIKNGAYSVIDRHYFKEAFYNQTPFISPVFLGRGFGSDPIVAVSAPIYSPGRSSHPAGILEGSLDLKRFVLIDRQNRHHSEQYLLLTDDNNRVIYASAPLNIASLSEFASAESGLEYRTSLQLINLHDLHNPNPEYIYAEEPLANGWRLMVLTPFAPLMQLAETQFLRTCILLILSMGFCFYLARLISRMMTGSLETIAHEFKSPGEQPKPLPADAPAEVQALYQSLKASQRQLLSYQLELEEKVAIRTLELETANQKLQALAQRDPLTGLYNRRHATAEFAPLQAMCERSGEAIAVVILDLDFFKAINDTHGHLAGDECLRQVAILLTQHFKRDSDLVARYGGEEFLLILPMTNALKIEHHLNQLREDLARHPVNHPSGDEPINLSVSIGAMVANANFSDSLEAWLKVADDNLYQAKAEGRNRVVCTLISDGVPTP
ncbi:sensor domain-containing diguanylate cyclase [Shewanella zhangzhouensis]|uniref:sensor domain-containing diguanylate cyclase n=1 Tax=Shewanella zhangzhouensis TaxID=2864213 RepID=UPI001C65DC8F|nr:diguanylate cyclase [Shewanella zhangzhouensis]QYK06794.1 diguanylate cyclase [Shewanella zhangzhouensis]